MITMRFSNEEKLFWVVRFIVIMHVCMCVYVMCEKCEMEMNKEIGLREIIMVGVAHEMTSDFNQMVESIASNMLALKTHS